MDAATPAPCRFERLMAPPLILASAASVAFAVFQTRTTWFRDVDTNGTWHAAVWHATALLLPLSVLLFALGVQWAVRRRPVLAVPALLPLPAWVACLLLVENLLANDCWIALIGLQLRGVQPFGAP